VIYGLLLLLAYLATNIIWLSLTITLILCALFLYVLNLTLFPLCQKNSLMFPHSLVTPSKPSSATMAVSSITPIVHSSPPKGHFYECLVPTLLYRMVKPSASSAPSIICCTPCFLGFYSGSLLDRRAPHHHISAKPPPHQGDQHDQPILHPSWSCPLL
jgi:hypothetical protein